MTDARLAAQAIDTESTHLAQARDSFVVSHETLVGAMANATAQLSDAEAGLDSLGTFSADVSKALGLHNIDLEFCIAKGRDPELNGGGGDGTTRTDDSHTGAEGIHIDKDEASAVRQLCKERLARDTTDAKIAMHNAQEEMQKAAKGFDNNATDSTADVTKATQASSAAIASAEAFTVTVASMLDYINDTLAERTRKTPLSPPPPPASYLTHFTDAANAVVTGKTPAAASAEKQSALIARQKSTQQDAADRSDQALSTAAKMGVAVASLKAVEVAHANVTNAKAALESALGLNTPSVAPLAAAATGKSVEDWSQDASLDTIHRDVIHTSSSPSEASSPRKESSDRDKFLPPISPSPSPSLPQRVDHHALPQSFADSASDSGSGDHGNGVPRDASAKPFAANISLASVSSSSPSSSPSMISPSTFSPSSLPLSSSALASLSHTLLPMVHSSFADNAVIAMTVSKMEELSNKKAKVIPIINPEPCILHPTPYTAHRSLQPELSRSHPIPYTLGHQLFHQHS